MISSIFFQEFLEQRRPVSHNYAWFPEHMSNYNIIYVCSAPAISSVVNISYKLKSECYIIHVKDIPPFLREFGVFMLSTCLQEKGGTVILTVTALFEPITQKPLASIMWDKIYTYPKKLNESNHININLPLMKKFLPEHRPQHT